MEHSAHFNAPLRLQDTVEQDVASTSTALTDVVDPRLCAKVGTAAPGLRIGRQRGQCFLDQLSVFEVLGNPESREGKGENLLEVLLRFGKQPDGIHGSYTRSTRCLSSATSSAGEPSR